MTNPALVIDPTRDVNCDEIRVTRIEAGVLADVMRSSRGLVLTEVIQKARERGAQRPLVVMRHLMDLQLVRLDKSKDERPARLKATPRAFGE